MGVSGIPSTPIPHIGRQYLAENTSGPEEGIKGVAEDVKGTATEAVGTVTGRDDLAAAARKPIRRNSTARGPTGIPVGSVGWRSCVNQGGVDQDCVDQDLR